MVKKRIDNRTGHVGVYRDRKYWQARIVRGGRVIWRENFATLGDAVAARGAKLEALGLPKEGPAPEPPTVPGARWILLSQGKFALIDEADFDRVSARNWFYSQRYAKTKDPAKPGRNLTLDRFLLDPPEGFEPDHINRDPLDCRRANLRIATRAENMRNHPKRRSNTSGFIGVSRYKQMGKWAAQASIGRTHVSLGLFTSAEEAARARDAWVREHHGSFASLNFPDEDPRGNPKGDSNR